jgi:hypothetical protein
MRNQADALSLSHTLTHSLSDSLSFRAHMHRTFSNHSSFLTVRRSTAHLHACSKATDAASNTPVASSSLLVPRNRSLLRHSSHARSRPCLSLLSTLPPPPLSSSVPVTSCPVSPLKPSATVPPRAYVCIHCDHFSATLDRDANMISLIYTSKASSCQQGLQKGHSAVRSDQYRRGRAGRHKQRQQQQQQQQQQHQQHTVCSNHASYSSSSSIPATPPIACPRLHSFCSSSLPSCLPLSHSLLHLLRYESLPHRSTPQFFDLTPNRHPLTQRPSSSCSYKQGLSKSDTAL